MQVPRANDFFVSGGTLPIGSASYVERECDRVLLEALSAGKYCYVLNTRQMGKSSLSVRCLARLEDLGWQTVSIDLTQMGGRNVTPEQWYTGLAAEVGRSLDLRSEVLAYCKENPHFGPMQRFFGSLREIVLQRISKPIIICIDEIDATRNLSFDTDEFFAGIRECFNHRVLDPQFQRLTFCLIGVAVPGDLARNHTTTPFNIGERIYLSDFTRIEMRKLEEPLGEKGRSVVDRIHYWANGHPYLSQSLCSAVALQNGKVLAATIDEVVTDTFFGPKARDRNVNLADVANRALNAGINESDPERFRADLLSTYERILKGKSVPDDEANRVASLLKLSGLVRSDGSRLYVRNRIYARVFNARWIRENMPGQELLRQQQSFRRGLLRATLVYGAILATVAYMGVTVWNSRHNLLETQDALDRELYVANMNNLRVFEEDGDIGRISEVLEQTRNSRFRGFEWNYWFGRLHDSKEEYALDYFAPGKREKGILSWDNRQICLVDDLTSTATVIDRSTKRVLKRTTLGAREEVVSTTKGFVIFDYNSVPAKVIDLLSGEAKFSIGDEGHEINLAVFRPHSNFVLVREGLVKSDSFVTLVLWDLTTARRVFSTTIAPGADMPVFRFSGNGERVVTVTRQLPQRTFVLSTWDTSTNRVIDTAQVEREIGLLEVSDNGDNVIYSAGSPVLIGRNVNTHSSVFRRTAVDGESPAYVCFASKGRVIGVVDASGRMSIEEYPSGRSLGTRYDVWYLLSSATSDEFVASATSVRVFNVRQPANEVSLARGFRLGRDGLGNIVVFETRPGGLQRLADPTLTPGLHTVEPPHFRMFTYNGRWQLTAERDKKQAWFSDTLGKIPPVRLSPIPTNFSCGLSNSIIAVYSQESSEIMGLSGVTGQEKWRYKLPVPDSNGVWVSPDSKSVIVFAGRQFVIVLDANTGKLRGIVNPHNLRISNLTFTSNGKGFFTFGADGRAILWSLTTLQEQAEFRGNAGKLVGSADLSLDGKRVVTSSEGGMWLIWDAATGERLTTVKASTGPLHGAIFTADGKSLLTVGEDSVIRVWHSLNRDPSVRIPVEKSLLKGIKH